MSHDPLWVAGGGGGRVRVLGDRAGICELAFDDATVVRELVDVQAEAFWLGTKARRTMTLHLAGPA